MVVLDTMSRAVPREEAQARTRQAAAFLTAHHASRIYKKICSGFRGNIGAELDALLEETGQGSIAVVAAFPKSGRVTRNGYHYVHGDLLEASEMAGDPVCPMRDSHLPTLLSRQTRRRVILWPIELVRAGAHALGEAQAELRRQGGIALVDAENQDDLRSIAKALREERVVAGAAGLAEELAGDWCAGLPTAERNARRAVQGARAPTEKSVLVVAGSRSPVTIRQNEHACASGWPRVTLAREHLTRGLSARRAVVEEVAGGLSAEGKCLLNLDSGTDLAASAPCAPLELANELGRIAHDVCASVRLLGLVLTGGDTAEAVTQALGITGVQLIDQIETGAASGLALPDARLFLVLKPGGFGGPDFYERAARHLRDVGAEDDHSVD